MSPFRRVLPSALFAVISALSAFTAVAQSDPPPGIEGMIHDQSGGAVSGVTVTVTSPRLIKPRSANSDAAGHFRILHLPPGLYTVTVAATGDFSGFTRTSVKVELSKSSFVDIALETKKRDSSQRRRKVFRVSPH